MNINFNVRVKTLAFFKQYQCRKTIESLIKVIKIAELRLKFCIETLPKILVDALNNDRHSAMKRIKMWAKKLENADNFHDYGQKLLFGLKRVSMFQTNEELQSIAKKIQEDKINAPFVVPQCKAVCNCCFESGILIACAGPCKAYYHDKCFNVEQSTNIDWHRFEHELEHGIEQNKRRVSEGTNSYCIQCKPSATTRRRRSCSQIARLDINTRNNHTNCETCKMNFNEDAKVACVRCSESYHLTSACIPAGALLLSETQLLCPNHSHLNPKKVSVCSICHKQSNRLQSCKKCANAFHKSCNPDQSKCQRCSTDHRQENIVCISTSRKWWPAIIISKDQIPKRLYGKRNKAGPGFVFAFIIGKNEYEEVHASDLLPFPANAPQFISALNKSNDQDMKNACEITITLDKIT